MEARAIFLAEAAKAATATMHVLEFFGREVVRRDNLDCVPLVEAMRELCCEHRRDSAGIAELQIVIGIFDAVRLHKPLPTADVEKGIESAKWYRQWLRQTFSDAGARPEQN